MGWVRDHRRYGAWPGLAAFALQIALSFGHIHIGHVHFDGVWRNAPVTAAKSPSALLAQSHQKAPARDSGQGSGDDDDYCPICASIFLASTSVAGQPPLLPVPAGFQRIALRFQAESGLSASRPAFFQSRAPPLA